ncbi:glycosyl transferase family 2 [Thermococcus peptonophilus]|uniref:Glycosyl transferase family 2 n=2 Tax=Thermococcus peptonophilus TaxID=53952 RepID=A0A142CXN1_9EURY|nr:glycosyl transferase family 2 [Thermococcus peptonophilus]
MNAPRVSIIILNWNGWEDTIECLESLYRITYPNYDVIVVDNGSKDDSVRKIKEYAEGKIEVNSKFFEYNPSNKPIKVFDINEGDTRKGKFNKPAYEKFDPNRRMILIKNKDNYGFAGGNNVGIKFALSVLTSDYILLLNNDTVVHPGFLTELVKVASSNKNIGAISPKIHYYWNGKIQYCGKTHKLGPIWTTMHKSCKPNKMDKGISSSLINTDEIHGACMLVKKDTLLSFGFLDEDYFAYWEETDFSLRLRKGGISLAVASLSTIWHKVGNRNILKKTIRPISAYLFGRNMILIILKNYTEFYKLLGMSILLILRIPLLLLNYILFYGNKKSSIYFALGVLAAMENERKSPILFYKTFNK